VLSRLGAAGGAEPDRVGPRNDARTDDLAERVLFVLASRWLLEVQPRRPRVPQVPDVAIHSLLSRPARVHHDSVAAAVGHRRDHARTARPAAAARLMTLVGRRCSTRIEGNLEV